MSGYIQAPVNKIRKDKFVMVIPIPKCLKDIDKKFLHDNSYVDPDTFSISIYGVVTPSVIVPPVENKYGGQSIKLSSHSRQPYTPLTISFTIDNRFNNYWFLYKWLDILNDERKSIYDGKDILNVTNVDPNTQTGVAVHTGTFSKQLKVYATDISVFVLDEYEKRVLEFKYFGAFPTGLGGITMSYRDPGEAETTAEFAYSFFTASLVEQVESL